MLLPKVNIIEPVLTGTITLSNTIKDFCAYFSLMLEEHG